MTPRTVTRPATVSDVEALAVLEQEAFGPEAWSAAGLRAEVDRDDRVVLVLVDDAEVNAPVVGWVDVSLAGDVADLLRIAVGEAARRRGLATALLASATEQAVGRGATRMLLEVAADNAPALALYRHHGFVELVHRRGYYAGGRDAVVMERHLTSPDEAGGAAP